MRNRFRQAPLKFALFSNSLPRFAPLRGSREAERTSEPHLTTPRPARSAGRTWGELTTHTRFAAIVFTNFSISFDRPRRPRGRCDARGRVSITTHHSFRGSFSAGSTPIFASKYAFCSIFQNLQEENSQNSFNIQLTLIAWLSSAIQFSNYSPRVSATMPALRRPWVKSRRRSEAGRVAPKEGPPRPNERGDWPGRVIQ